jgi:hypothetical protein
MTPTDLLLTSTLRATVNYDRLSTLFSDPYGPIAYQPAVHLIPNIEQPMRDAFNSILQSDIEDLTVRTNQINLLAIQAFAFYQQARASHNNDNDTLADERLTQCQLLLNQIILPYELTIEHFTEVAAQALSTHYEDFPPQDINILNFLNLQLMPVAASIPQEFPPAGIIAEGQNPDSTSAAPSDG